MFHKKDEELNEVFFFWIKKNVKLKYNKSYKSKERYQENIVIFFQTMSDIGLNISLQWWFISQSIDK